MTRLFIATFATGFSYADTTIEVHGDYQRLAFLPFSTLELEISRGCPPDLEEEIRAHAATFEPGQVLEVSMAGQTVTLGTRAVRPAAKEPADGLNLPIDR